MRSTRLGQFGFLYDPSLAVNEPHDDIRADSEVDCTTCDAGLNDFTVRFQLAYNSSLLRPLRRLKRNGVAESCDWTTWTLSASGDEYTSVCEKVIAYSSMASYRFKAEAYFPEDDVHGTASEEITVNFGKSFPSFL